MSTTAGPSTAASNSPPTTAISSSAEPEQDEPLQCPVMVSDVLSGPDWELVDTRLIFEATRDTYQQQKETSAGDAVLFSGVAGEVVSGELYDEVPTAMGSNAKLYRVNGTRIASVVGPFDDACPQYAVIAHGLDDSEFAELVASLRMGPVPGGS